MLPRDGLPSETEIFVTDGRQSAPLSGFTDLEPGDVLGTSPSPLVHISPAALHDPSAVLLPTTHTTDVHALHDNIPVADDGLPSTDTQPTPTALCPELLARLNADQRSSFLQLWGRLPPHLSDITFDLQSTAWSLADITALGDVLCEFHDVFSTSTILVHVLFSHSRSLSSRLPLAPIPSLRNRSMPYSISTWLPFSSSTGPHRTPSTWSPY